MTSSIRSRWELWLPRTKEFYLLLLILSLAWALASLPAPIAAAPSRSAADQYLLAVRQKLIAIQPFSVTFSNHVSLAGDAESEETGLILFQDYRHLKWTYQKPERKIFVLKGDDYQFYLEGDRQLFRGKLGGGREQLIWYFLFSDAPGQSVSVDPVRRTISIHSTTEDDGLDLTIRLGSDLLPEAAVQKDPSGIENIFSFRNYRPHIVISARDLELQIPADTEIIDEFTNK